LQNFQSSLAEREYWKRTWSTSKASSSPARNVVDRVARVFDELSQLGVVIHRDGFSCGLSFGLRGHRSRLTRLAGA
jgi:hypothetical protein